MSENVQEKSLSNVGQNDYSKELLSQLYEANDENTYESEIRYSRTAILQPASPEIASQAPGYKAGMIVDSVNREPLTTYCKPPWAIDAGVSEEDLQKLHCMPFIVVSKLPTEFIRWKDRNTEGNGFHWKSLERTDPRVVEGVWPKQGGRWGTKPDQVGVKPPVTENINYLILPLDYSNEEGIKRISAKSGLIVATFAVTGYKAGTDLTTYLNNQRFKQLPPWGIMYWLYTSPERNEEKNSTYYIPKIAKGMEFNVFKSHELSKAEALKIEEMSLAAAIQLADREHGKDRQLDIINAAHLDEGLDDVDQSGNSTVNSSTFSGSDSKDPFENPDSSDLDNPEDIGF